MQVTDRTLMITGLITFLVTLGCVTVILIKIGGVGGLTGLVLTNTSYGRVNVTIEPSTAVTLVTSVVDFGSGTLDNAGNVLNTSDGDNAGTNPNGFSKPGPFRLRNDGNVYVNVTLNGSTPSQLLGVTSSSVNYSFATKNISSTELFNNTCANKSTGVGINYFHYANSSSTQPFGITMSNSFQMVCPNMSYVAASDEFNVSIFFNLSTTIATNVTYSDVVGFFITSLGHS